MTGEAGGSGEIESRQLFDVAMLEFATACGIPHCTIEAVLQGDVRAEVVTRERTCKIN